MELQILNTSHKEVSKVPVKDTLITDKEYQEAIYLAVNAYLASKRQGTSKVKGRSDVVGSTRKPWKQKGTGRARVSSVKSPLWRGGGITFGPTGNRNYTKKQNKKSYKKAMLTIITQRLNQKQFHCYEKFPLEKPQTKAIFNFLKGNNFEKEKILFVTREFDNMLYLSTKNMQNVQYKTAKQVGVYDLMYAKHTLFNKEGFNELERIWG